MLTSLKRFALLATSLVAFSLVAEAQILIVDDERVEREAAAYKDFNLQTNDIRQNILQLRQFIARGGVIEQQLAELEQRKSIIGNDGYEEEKRKLERQFLQAQQTLGVLEFQFDKLRQEAVVQVERARQPVIRNLLSERKAQLIMMKRLVMGHAAGMDVTTEFIERLNVELPTVSITVPQNNAPASAPATPEKKSDKKK